MIWLETTKEKHRKRSEKVPNQKLPLFSGTHGPLGKTVLRVLQTRDAHSNFGVQGFCFILLFFNGGMVDEIIHCLTVHFPCPPSRLGWYYVAQSLNLLIIWLVFLGYPTPILNHLISINYLGAYYKHLISINYQVWSERPTINNKDWITPITWEIPVV